MSLPSSSSVPTKLPSDQVTSKVVAAFNGELRRLADLLKSEFFDNMIVRRSHAKLMTALKMNQTLPFNLFQIHVQPEYGAMILSRDAKFIDTIRDRYANEKDSEDLMPTVALIWEEGGKVTKNPKLLQNLILQHLINLCKVHPLKPSEASSSSTVGGKTKSQPKTKSVTRPAGPIPMRPKSAVTKVASGAR